MTKQEREIFMAGALAFVAHLSGQPGTVKMGAKHNVAPAVEGFKRWDGSEHQRETLSTALFSSHGLR